MQIKNLALAALLPLALSAPAALSERATALWSIRSFSRGIVHNSYARYANFKLLLLDCTDPNICTYKFGIDIGDGSTPTACTIVDTSNPATNHSFYGVPCQQVSSRALTLRLKMLLLVCFIN
jgi:hypothetical protein